MRGADEDAYRAFAAVQLHSLQGPAYLLCGDWHQAQDLVQTVLVKMYGAWARLSPEVDRHAYARAVLVNVYISSRRRHRWRREILTDQVKDVPEWDASDVGERQAQRELLMSLPPRRRAVIVLRFLEDFSIDQTAHVLGITSGTVKSQTAAALKTLRASLEETTS